MYITTVLKYLRTGSYIYIYMITALKKSKNQLNILLEKQIPIFASCQLFHKTCQFFGTVQKN